MADRDIEQAADMAAEYVRITRGPLDGNARGPIVNPEDIFDAVLADDLDDPGPLAADDLDELEVTD